MLCSKKILELSCPPVNYPGNGNPPFPIGNASSNHGFEDHFLLEKVGLKTHFLLEKVGLKTHFLLEKVGLKTISYWKRWVWRRISYWKRWVWRRISYWKRWVWRPFPIGKGGFEDHFLLEKVGLKSISYWKRWVWRRISYWKRWVWRRISYWKRWVWRPFPIQKGGFEDHFLLEKVGLKTHFLLEKVGLKTISYWKRWVWRPFPIGKGGFEDHVLLEKVGLKAHFLLEKVGLKTHFLLEKVGLKTIFYWKRWVWRPFPIGKGGFEDAFPIGKGGFEDHFLLEKVGLKTHFLLEKVRLKMHFLLEKVDLHCQVCLPEGTKTAKAIIYIYVWMCFLLVSSPNKRPEMHEACGIDALVAGAQGFCASNSSRNGLLLLFFTQRVHPVSGRKNHSEAHALCDDFYFEMFEVLGGSEKLKRNAANKMAGDPFTHLLPSSFQNKSLWLPLGCPIHFDRLIRTTNKKRKDGKTCSAAGHWILRVRMPSKRSFKHFSQQEILLMAQNSIQHQLLCRISCTFTYFFCCLLLLWSKTVG